MTAGRPGWAVAVDAPARLVYHDLMLRPLRGPARHCPHFPPVDGGPEQVRCVTGVLRVGKLDCPDFPQSAVRCRRAHRGCHHLVPPFVRASLPLPFPLPPELFWISQAVPATWAQPPVNVLLKSVHREKPAAPIAGCFCLLTLFLVRIVIADN